MEVLDAWTQSTNRVQCVLLVPEAISRANAAVERYRVLNSVLIVNTLKSYSRCKRLGLRLIEITRLQIEYAVFINQVLVSPWPNTTYFWLVRPSRPTGPRA